MNNKGFTLIELLIAILIAAVIGAGLFEGYRMVIPNTDTAAIVNNITRLKAMAKQYAKMNGYSFSGINPTAMQADGLIPSGWTVNMYDVYPPDQNVVDAYRIGQGYWGVQGAFVIGFDSNNNNITNNMARNICNDFLNQIAGFGYNGTAYAVSSGGTNCNAIPANNNPVPLQNQFVLGFE